MRNKVIYFKSVFKGFKPDDKVTKLIDEALVKANVLNNGGNKKKLMDSRQFILKHTEDFLNYAVDYSINDKLNEFIPE